MVRLRIEKCGAGKEFSLEAWEKLCCELAVIAGRKEPIENVISCDDIAGRTEQDFIEDVPTSSGIDSGSHISDIDTSTLRNRLINAKQEYDYNRTLIEIFQREIKNYRCKHNSTSIVMSNGAMVVIPAVTNLDKYSKLNISLSKLINSLEQDLDLEVDNGDNDIFS